MNSKSNCRSATATPTQNTKQGAATGGRNKKKFGRRSIEGLGHEDSDEENDGGSATAAGPSAPAAATGGLNGEEEMVPASKLREVERKYEVLSKKLQVYTICLRNKGYLGTILLVCHLLLHVIGKWEFIYFVYFCIEQQSSAEITFSY